MSTTQVEPSDTSVKARSSYPSQPWNPSCHIPATVVSVNDRSGVVRFHQFKKARFHRNEAIHNGKLVDQNESLTVSLTLGKVVTVTSLWMLNAGPERLKGIEFTAAIRYVDGDDVEIVDVYEKGELGLFRCNGKKVFFKVEKIFIDDGEVAKKDISLTSFVCHGKRINLTNSNNIVYANNFVENHALVDVYITSVYENNITFYCREMNELTLVVAQASRKYISSKMTQTKFLPITSGPFAGEQELQEGSSMSDKDEVSSQGSHPSSSDMRAKSVEATNHNPNYYKMPFKETPPSMYRYEGVIRRLSGDDGVFNTVDFKYNGQDYVAGFFITYLSLNGFRPTISELGEVKRYLRVGMPVSLGNIKQRDCHPDSIVKFLAVVNITSAVLYGTERPTPRIEQPEVVKEVIPPAPNITGQEVKGIVESLSNTARTGVARLENQLLASFVIKQIVHRGRLVAIPEYANFVRVGMMVTLKVKNSKVGVKIPYEAEVVIEMEEVTRKVLKEALQESETAFPNDQVFYGMVAETIINRGVPQPRIVTVTINKVKENVFIPLRSVKVDGEKLGKVSLPPNFCKLGMNVKLTHLKLYNKTYKYEAKVEFLGKSFGPETLGVEEAEGIEEEETESEDDIDEETKKVSTELHKIDVDEHNQMMEFIVSPGAKKRYLPNTGIIYITGKVAELWINKSKMSQPKIVTAMIGDVEEKVFIPKNNVKISGKSIEKCSDSFDYKIGLNVQLSGFKPYNHKKYKYSASVIMGVSEARLYYMISDLSVEEQNEIINWTYSDVEFLKVNENLDKVTEQEETQMNSSKSSKKGKNTDGKKEPNQVVTHVENEENGDEVESNSNDSKIIKNLNILGEIVTVTTPSKQVYYVAHLVYNGRKEYGLIYKNRLTVRGKKLSPKDDMAELLTVGLPVMVLALETYNKHGFEYLAFVDIGRDYRQKLKPGIPLTGLRDAILHCGNSVRGLKQKNNEISVFCEGKLGNSQSMREMLNSFEVSPSEVEKPSSTNVCNIKGVLGFLKDGDSTTTSTLIVSFFKDSTTEIALTSKEKMTIDGKEINSKEMLELQVKEGMPVTITKLLPYSNEKNGYRHVAHIDVKQSVVQQVLDQCGKSKTLNGTQEVVDDKLAVQSKDLVKDTIKDIKNSDKMSAESNGEAWHTENLGSRKDQAKELADSKLNVDTLTGSKVNANEDKQGTDQPQNTHLHDIISHSFEDFRIISDENSELDSKINKFIDFVSENNIALHKTRLAKESTLDEERTLIKTDKGKCQEEEQANIGELEDKINNENVVKRNDVLEKSKEIQKQSGIKPKSSDKPIGGSKELTENTRAIKSKDTPTNESASIAKTVNPTVKTNKKKSAEEEKIIEENVTKTLTIVVVSNNTDKSDERKNSTINGRKKDISVDVRTYELSMTEHESKPCVQVQQMENKEMEANLEIIAAKKLKAAEEVKRVATEKEAKRLDTEREVKRNEAEKEAKRLDTEEAKRLERVKEAKRLEVLKEAKRLEAEMEAKRLEAEKETKRLEAEKETKRLEAEKETKRLEADKETKRLEAVKEAKSLEAVKEAKRLEAVKEAKRLEAVKEARRLEAEKKARKLEAEKKSKNLEADLEIKKLEGEKETKRLEADKKRGLLEAEKMAQRLETEKDPKKVEVDTEVNKVESKKIAKKLETEMEGKRMKVDRGERAEKETKNLEADMEVKIVMTEKEVKKLASDKEAKRIEMEKEARKVEPKMEDKKDANRDAETVCTQVASEKVFVKDVKLQDVSETDKGSDSQEIETTLVAEQPSLSGFSLPTKEMEIKTPTAEIHTHTTDAKVTKEQTKLQRHEETKPKSCYLQDDEDDDDHPMFYDCRPSTWMPRKCVRGSTALVSTGLNPNKVNNKTEKKSIGEETELLEVSLRDVFVIKKCPSDQGEKQFRHQSTQTITTGRIMTIDYVAD